MSQRLAGTPADVLGVLTDPSFVEEMRALPRIADPELLEHRVAGGTFHQHIRYRFAGHLPSAVTAVLDPERLVWSVQTDFDLERATATFQIVPEHYANRLRCSGTHALVADGPGASVRTVAGDLSVRYPLVGGAVERAIASGLAEHLEDEAALIGRVLAR
jgi:hypothetical protein